MRSRLPSATAALTAVVMLSGCFPVPPADETITVSLETADGQPVELEATVPGGGEDGGTVAASGCVDDAQAWDLPALDDSIISFATTSTATSCPDDEPVNGGFPSWASAAELPDDAVPIELAGVPSAHRFALEYTECTNFCQSWMRELALLEFDSASVLVSATGPSAERFDRMLESIVVLD